MRTIELPPSVLGEALRDADVLKNHIITNTREIAMERFRALKQGQNFHALDDALKTNTYTDISRTQGTIYLRLDYDAPSGTIVNVRNQCGYIPHWTVLLVCAKLRGFRLSRTALYFADLRISNISRSVMRFRL